jgi:hypothetical protein
MENIEAVGNNMTKLLFAILSVFCIGIGVCLASSAKPRQITAPLAFEANAGSPAFLCRGDGFHATLLPERLVLRPNVPGSPDVVVRFVGANALARGNSQTLFTAPRLRQP